MSLLNTYIALAQKCARKAERDYYVTSAKIILRQEGVDISGISEEPHQALSELKELVGGAPKQPTPPYQPLFPSKKPPYSELFEGIEGLF